MTKFYFKIDGYVDVGEMDKSLPIVINHINHGIMYLQGIDTSLLKDALNIGHTVRVELVEVSKVVDKNE